MDWRDLFVANANNSLEFFPPDADGGVSIPQSVADEGIEEFKSSIVAQFLGRPPAFVFLSRILSQIWKQCGTVRFSQIGTNLFLFRFDSDKARDWVLENGPWHIKNNTMILRKWLPNLDCIDFTLDSFPIWFHLRRIPLEYYNRTGLSYIASALGTPLYMDSVTASRTRLSYAKVCVEVSAQFAIPETIPVTLASGRTFQVSVSAPWIPPCCAFCNTFSHGEQNCHKAVDKGKALQKWQPKVNADAATSSNSSELQKDLLLPTNSGSAELGVSNPSVLKGKGTIDDCSPFNINPQFDQLPVSMGASTSSALGYAVSNGGSSVIQQEVTLSPLVDLNPFQLVVYKRPAFSRKSIHSSASSSQSSSRYQFSCFTNKYLALANESVEQISAEMESNEEWQKMIDTAKSPRKKRAASKGLQNVLDAVKSTKALNLAKATNLAKAKGVKGIKVKKKA